MPTKPGSTTQQAARVAALVAIRHGASTADAITVRQQVLQDLERQDVPHATAPRDTAQDPVKPRRPLQ